MNKSPNLPALGEDAETRAGRIQETQGNGLAMEAPCRWLRVCNLYILRIMGRRSYTEKYPEHVQFFQ